MLRIAYRGFQKLHPENSLSAIRHAMIAGFKGVEFDVRASKDRKLYVHHDQKLGRTTNFIGKVRQWASSDLRHCKLRNGEPLATLDQVFASLQKYTGTIFLHYKEQGEERQILRLIRKYRLINHVIITQFIFTSLQTFRSLDKNIALFFENTILLEKDLDNAKGVGCMGVSVHPMFMTRKMIREAHKRKLLVYPFAHWFFYSNPAKVLRIAKSYGADGAFLFYE